MPHRIVPITEAGSDNPFAPSRPRRNQYQEYPDPRLQIYWAAEFYSRLALARGWKMGRGAGGQGFEGKVLFYVVRDGARKNHNKRK